MLTVEITLDVPIPQRRRVDKLAAARRYLVRYEIGRVQVLECADASPLTSSTIAAGCEGWVCALAGRWEIPAENMENNARAAFSRKRLVPAFSD